MTDRERFIALVDNDIVLPSDAVILLEGDGLNRYKHAVKLYHDHMARVIVFSGGVDNRPKGSFPHTDIVPLILSEGVPQRSIIIEEGSKNTYEQARAVLEMAVQFSWQRIILVASHYHQYRAYLTFLKEAINKNSGIVIYNSPERGLLWFKENVWGSRFSLLEDEFMKIEKFSALGHLADFQQAIDYQQWKETRHDG